MMKERTNKNDDFQIEEREWEESTREKADREGKNTHIEQIIHTK